MIWNAHHIIKVCVYHITYLGTGCWCCPTAECTLGYIVIVLGITCRMVICLVRRWMTSSKSLGSLLGYIMSPNRTEHHHFSSHLEISNKMCVQQVSLTDRVYKWHWYCGSLPSCRLDSSVSCRLSFAGCLQKSKVENKILHLSEMKFLVLLSLNAKSIACLKAAYLNVSLTARARVWERWVFVEVGPLCF